MLAIVYISKQIIAQSNLIPNSSFEIISDCPDDFLTGGIGLAEFWSSAMATPDIYNACAPFDFGGVPINTTNCYQPAHSGNGYAGISPFYTIPRTTEYMEVKLNEKLIKEKRYFVRFYVSARNCSDHEICYSDAMGLAFSDTFYQEDVITGAEQIPPFVPVIQNPAGNILKDTLDWMEISGCYTATGTEQYAIIGSFKTSANTQSEGCVGVTGSYYYIDDVGVYEFDPLPDTLVLCSGETRTIGRSFLNASYLWNTGVTDSTLAINKEGLYIVNITIGNCTLSDTILVFEIDKLLKLLPLDTLLCKGEKLDVTIPLTGVYLWSNGSTSNQISISEGGTYTVDIQNNCGVFNHTFEVASEVCDCKVYVPNAFSPDGDNNNDYLQCFVGCDFPYQSICFQIFDRWGGLVYSNESKDNQNISWDGSFRGKVLDAGVYAWIFEYEYTRNGIVTKKIISGDVSIIK